VKSLWFRNLIFTILQPGLVVGLIPWLLTKSKLKSLLDKGLPPQAFISIPLFLIGLYILIDCVVRFGKEGKGTLSPLYPTKRLVNSGLYKYSRNPMYVGAVLALVSESILISSIALWIYTSFVVAGFHLFILFHEEPRMERAFGEAYLRYKRKVPRWVNINLCIYLAFIQFMINGNTSLE
jgi:protein-S-isoprenylcysteine O-methyltransferase Ste14